MCGLTVPSVTSTPRLTSMHNQIDRLRLHRIGHRLRLAQQGVADEESDAEPDDPATDYDSDLVQNPPVKKLDRILARRRRNVLASFALFPTSASNLDLATAASSTSSTDSVDRAQVLSSQAIAEDLSIVPEEEIEYLVKYEGFSYLHCEWRSLQWLRANFSTRSVDAKWKTFHRSVETTEAEQLDRYGGAPFDPRFITIDTILSHRRTADNETEFLVKWSGLSFAQCTWERRQMLDDEQSINEYFDRIVSSQVDEPPPPNAIPPPSADSPPKRFYNESKVYKNGHELRQYQVQGLNWLVAQWTIGRNCILADEMGPCLFWGNQSFVNTDSLSLSLDFVCARAGLGKTVQAVALLEHLVTNDWSKGPFLVVAPLSTLDNWRSELLRWTNLRLCVYHDAQKGDLARKIIRRYCWPAPHQRSVNDSSATAATTNRQTLEFLPPPSPAQFHVLLTSYEVAINDCHHLQRFQWHSMVIDEGHRLKNSGSALFDALQRLHCPRRVLLTGTPIQNNTSELFNLLHFLEPANFHSSRDFETRFGSLTSMEQVEELQRRIRPYILRRLKAQVERSIPPKDEIVIDIELTATQRRYYQAVYTKNMGFLKSSMSSTTESPRLLNLEMELRKVCNHAFLISGAVDKEVGVRPTQPSPNDPDTVKQQYQQWRAQYAEQLVACSGKMVLLDKLLPKLKADGHRVLIFSQMVMALDLLEQYCSMRGHAYERIDGSVTGNHRYAAIDRFNRPGSNRFIFLLSTRAGGVGLNLATADTVIIFDPDYNPQQDLQVSLNFCVVFSVCGDPSLSPTTLLV